MKDPAGTIHSYSYDQHGRLLHDRVTALPAALDGTVRRISRSYDAAGRWTRISSWDKEYLTAPAGQPAPVAVNEVKLETNAWGQFTADRQAHSGLVDAASPVIPVGSVQYGYANGADNHLRRTSLTMPSGRQVLTEYDAGFDDRLSRFTRLRLADGVSYTPVLSQTYAGSNRVVRMDYPQPQLQWTLVAQAGENTLNNKVPYTGLDRFGRMIQARWLTAPATGTPQTRVHVRYWYDRGSRRIWRDAPNAPAGTKEAEGYTYDGLSQVTGRQRGQLQFDTQGAITGIAAPPEREEAFRYDTLGNCLPEKAPQSGVAVAPLSSMPLSAAARWQHYTVKEPDLTNPPAQISVLDQTRSHNSSNQITGFSNSTEPVTYDPAGNTTRTAPSPSGDWSKSVKYVWDAWNRLIAVLDASSSDAEIARHAYDGITRRTWLREGGTSGTVRHFFYNDQWRSVEERIGTSGNAERQHVFHPANRWHLILRDRKADGVGTSLEERLYSLHDAMDPVAITDATGAVVERYSYSAFGQRRVMDAIFADKAGGTSKAWNWEFHGEYASGLTNSPHNYGFRSYMPGNGTWLSRDPAESNPEHGFRAVLNSPVNLLDLAGMDEYNPVVDGIKKITTPIRALTGLASSVLSGDVFANYNTTNPQKAYQSDQCVFLLTVTGMNEPWEGQKTLAEDLMRLPAFRNVPRADWSYNPTRFGGAGDAAQVLGNELAAIDVPAKWLASRIENAANNSCRCWCMTLVGHSQGTMVITRALELIDSKYLPHIALIGIGGETTFGPHNKVQSTSNFDSRYDPVPNMLSQVSFWNGNDRLHLFGDKDNAKAPEYERNTGLRAQDRRETYMPFFRVNPSLIKACKSIIRNY